jgi:hypothetical protein
MWVSFWSRAGLCGRRLLPWLACREGNEFPVPLPLTPADIFEYRVCIVIEFRGVFLAAFSRFVNDWISPHF